MDQQIKIKWWKLKNRMSVCVFAANRNMKQNAKNHFSMFFFDKKTKKKIFNWFSSTVVIHTKKTTKIDMKLRDNAERQTIVYWMYFNWINAPIGGFVWNDCHMHECTLLFAFSRQSDTPIDSGQTINCWVATIIIFLKSHLHVCARANTKLTTAKPSFEWEFPSFEKKRNRKIHKWKIGTVFFLSIELNSQRKSN